jgi:hypothetical protein
MSKTDQESQLSEQSFQFLLKEYETLKDLYTQAETGAQSIFNFYLTLLTTVSGGAVVILQFTPKSIDPNRAIWILGGVLLFIASIGTTYLSSISGRYAHLVRYAQGIDEIRRFLIQRLDVPLPPIYQDFIAGGATAHKNLVQKVSDRLVWVFPIGTYQFFIVALNGLSLAAATWVFFKILHYSHTHLAIFASVIVFLFMNSVYNLYSRLVMRSVTSKLNVSIDIVHQLPYVSGKL